jgi:hypothetical protein
VPRGGWDSVGGGRTHGVSAPRLAMRDARSGAPAADGGAAAALPELPRGGRSMPSLPRVLSSVHAAEVIGRNFNRRMRTRKND